MRFASSGEARPAGRFRARAQDDGAPCLIAERQISRPTFDNTRYPVESGKEIVGPIHFPRLRSAIRQSLLFQLFAIPVHCAQPQRGDFESSDSISFIRG